MNEGGRMLTNHQLVPTPLFEMEQLKRDKQREYQALYMPAMFEGVRIGAPFLGAPLRGTLQHAVAKLDTRLHQLKERLFIRIAVNGASK